MLCLSGFELYSRWVPLIDTIYDEQNKRNFNLRLFITEKKQFSLRHHCFYGKHSSIYL